VKPPGGWLALLPSALLVIVAGHQIRLARVEGMSPWLGGGFGMFSTFDGWSHRHLRAYALRSGVRRELEIPEALRDEVAEALALPSDAQLTRIAEALAHTPSPDEGPLEAVVVQVFRPRLDPETLQPSGELVRGIEFRPTQP
jgi:hypothetical protein